MDQHKAEIILPNTFKKIQRACPFRLNSGLKNACNEALKQLKKAERHDALQEEKYWTVFDMSLKSGSPDIIGAALEGVVFLVEAKLLKVEYNVEHEPSSGDIFITNEDLVEDVCRGVENLCTIGNEGAFAMAKRFGIKALIACIVNEEIPVHSLLLPQILKLLLKLGASSKSPSAAEPFISAMKEVASIVFFRMEAKDVRILDMKKKEEEIAAASRVVDGSDEENVKEEGREETRALDDEESIKEERMDMDTTAVAATCTTTPADCDRSEELQPQLTVDVEHVDALRCLQELSSIESTEDSTSSIIKMKVLLGLVQNSGTAFGTTPMFLNCVKGELCGVLRKHLTSGSTPLISYALRIFVSLTRLMKDKLKPEVQIFVSTIFLRVLESSNQIEEQKLLVLEVLCDLCQDPISLVEVFVNNDCDLGADNLLICIVTSIARVAKQYPPAVGTGRPPVTGQGNLKLREMAVQGLVLILQSLIRAGHLYGVSGSPCLNQSSQLSLDRNESSFSIKSSQHHRSPSASPRTSLDGEKEKRKCGGSEGGGESDSSEKGSPSSFKQHASVISNVELKMKLQEELELGIVKFNVNPTAVIKWLATHGYLNLNDAKSVANFFHTHSEKLTKTNIGEYLGRDVGYSEGFNASVLRAYTEAMDFNDLSFVDAIRHFFKGFQLPGEAQKIDRIMEMFAERFCICNPGVFPSADAAFVLAFSIIMLNTDLHSLAIKDEMRMSESDFIANNHRVSYDGGDELSPEFIGEIYDQIKCTPIALKGDEALRIQNAPGFIRSAFNRNGSRIKQALNEERNDMLKVSEDLLSRSSKQLSGSIFADSLCPPPPSQSDGGEDVGLKAAAASDNNISSELFVDLVHIFEVVWGPMVGVFSHVFEMAESLPLVKLCTYGSRLGVGISCALELNTALETFVNTLTQFATLRGSPTVEISSLNIICLQTLLTICQIDGDKLETSWYPILQCMTQFQKLQVLSNNNPGGSTSAYSSPRKRMSSSSVQFDSSATVVSEKSGLRTNNIKHTRAATYDVGDVPSPSNLSSKGSSSVGISIPIEGGPPVLNEQLSAFGDGKLPFQNYRKEIVIRCESLHMDITQPSLTPNIVEPSPKLTPDNTSSPSLKLKHEIDSLDIEVIFTESSNFSCDGLRHLVDGLIASGNGKDPADTAHCLHWLVQVADINMDFRSRLEWQPLWASVGGYLAVLGSQGGEPQISILAMGYLQQLALKFLAKPELWDFHFQRDFLGPFEAAVACNPEVHVREFVLKCVEQLVTFEASYLRSGWVTVFSVLASASRDTSSHIVDMAYHILDSIVKNCLDLVIEADFSSLVLCLTLFTTAESLGVVFGSVEHLQMCGRLLSSGSVNALKQRPPPPVMIPPNILSYFIPTPPPSTPHQSSSQNKNSVLNDDQMIRNEVSSSELPEMEEDVIITTQQFSESEDSDQLENSDVAVAAVKEEEDEISKLHDDPLLHLWWCILEGLARSAGDERFDVRKIGISTIKNLLREATHSAIEDTPFWSLVFTRILFPIVTHVSDDVSGTAFLSSSPLKTGDNHFPINANSWIATTVLEIFELIVDTYVDIPSVSRKQCLPCIMEFFSWYVCSQDVEAMVVFAVEALHKLVDKLARNELSTSNLRATNQVDLSEPTSDEQNSCYPFTNRILDELCISISNMLLNSLQPMVGPFRTGKSNLVGSTSKLSKKVPDEITTVASEEHDDTINEDNQDDGIVVEEEMETIDLRRVMTKFVATLHVQTLGFHMLMHHFLHLRSTSITHLLGSMRSSYLYGRSVNEDFNLRSWLQRSGFGEERWEGGILPNLLQQEMDGERLYIGALFMILGISIAEQYDEGTKKKSNTKLNYCLDYWKERKSCSSLLSAGEAEGDGGGSSSDYHHPTPNISMEKWVAMPDGRDCQQTAHLLLEMADELINRHLHVENTTLSDWTREVQMEMLRTVETEDEMIVKNEPLEAPSMIDWDVEKVELSKQLSLSTEYLLQGVLHFLISKQEPTTMSVANHCEKDGTATNTAIDDVKFHMMEWLYPYLIELIAVSQLPIRLCIRDILKFSFKRIYSLEPHHRPTITSP